MSNNQREAKCYTYDGHPISVGMTVYTNEVKRGVVITEPDSQGWFDVKNEDGTRTLQNGPRVTVTKPGYFKEAKIKE